MSEMKKALHKVVSRYDVHIRQELWKKIAHAEQSKLEHSIISIWTNELSPEDMLQLKLDIEAVALAHSYSISVFYNNIVMLMDLEER